jgi:hypothetical protein
VKITHDSQNCAINGGYLTGFPTRQMEWPIYLLFNQTGKKEIAQTLLLSLI